MKTRVQLMDESLHLAGLDSGYYALTRGWLNTIIEAQARNFDWPFYAKTAADVALVSGTLAYSVPTDFARPNTIFLIQNSQKGSEIKVVDPGLFEVYKPATTIGTPRFATVYTVMGASAPTQTLNFDQVPSNGAQSYRLAYYRLPVAMSLDSSDDSKVPDFLNQDFLIEELIKKMMKDEDDTRYDAQKGESAEVERKAKFNTYQANASTVTLDRGRFPVGGGRRRKGWGWFGP